MKLVITMSRRFGTGASIIADELSKRLDIPVYDRAYIEQQVNDAQIGQKAKSLLEHLVIGLWGELRIFERKVLLGVNAFAEIILVRHKLSMVFRSTYHGGLDINKRTDQMAEFFVEIY